MAAFGFGVGDFLAGAELAYKLGRALSDSGGSSQSYRELMAELDVIHKVLLQVDQLRAANQLAKPTINALLFTVNSANESMKHFIEQNGRYHDSLKSGGSGNVLKDAFYKGKWATQMPEKTRDLRMCLASTLAAINTLVSLACYQNRPDGDCVPDYSITLQPTVTSSGSCYESRWADIKLHGIVWSHGPGRIQDPDFLFPKDPKLFFRPGQIFATPITSTFQVSAKTRGREITPRSVTIGNSPLGPVRVIDAASPKDVLEDKRERLRQIRNLPLSQMTQYCASTQLQRGKVECLLCDNSKVKPFKPSVTTQFTREDWAAFHFRVAHWNYYLSMMGPSIPKRLGHRFSRYLVPQNVVQKPPEGLGFSSTDWITIEDIASHFPILTDKEIIVALHKCSNPRRSQFANYRGRVPRITANDAEPNLSPCNATIEGPVLIRRFLVVREGKEQSLCLGIHTYAGKGSADQSDQQLFAIIHPGKSAPQPLPTEPNIVLCPIRMKPDHPSTALPESARIHFGRVYEVSHYVRAQALGLVHPTSMETLELQFEANVERMSENDEAMTSVEEEKGQEGPNAPSAADEQVVQEIRGHVEGVLGSKFSPAYHPPPECTRRDEATGSQTLEGKGDESSAPVPRNRTPAYLDIRRRGW